LIKEVTLMKQYKNVEIEIELTADVITTSEKVTTEDIIIDWGSGASSAFEL